MKAKIGLIAKDRFVKENYDPIIQNAFEEVVFKTVPHMYILAMEEYIDGYYFDVVFNDMADYNDGLVYYLIPLEIIPYIKHYSGYVAICRHDLIFDVVLQYDDVIVEGETLRVPSNVIKMLPCCSTRYDEEAVMVLDAVIENWNVSNPDKAINFQYMFQNLGDFMNFRNGQI